MENKQTAVDWLIELMQPSLTEEQKKCFITLFDKSKAMERDQIIDAIDDAYIAMNLAFRGFDRSVEYYEKTYGK